MKTKDLHALMPTNYVGTWKPDGCKEVPFVRNFDIDVARKVVKVRYEETLAHNRKTVDEAFTGLYGKPLFFSDKITGDLVFKIKTIMKETGKTLKEIGQDFKVFFGKECSFFRNVGEKQIPVDSVRIMNAYRLIKIGGSREAVEAILYK